MYHRTDAGSVRVAYAEIICTCGQPVELEEGDTDQYLSGECECGKKWGGNDSMGYRQE